MSPIPLGILASAGAGAAGSYDLLETEILTSNASSVTFTGLGSYSDYKHLQIRAVARSTRSAVNENVRMQMNNDTGSNYSRHQLRGDGSSVISEAATSQSSAFVSTITAASQGSNQFSGNVIDILDFSDSSKNTTIRTLYGSPSTEIGLASGAFFNTAAITEIDLILQSGGSFITGSRFSLYGLKAGA